MVDVYVEICCEYVMNTTPGKKLLYLCNLLPIFTRKKNEVTDRVVEPHC